MRMQKRAMEFVRALNDKGWTVNEQMADQFVIFAKAECARTVAQFKTECAKITVNYTYTE